MKQSEMNTMSLLRTSFFSTRNLALSTARNNSPIKQFTSTTKSCILRKKPDVTINYLRKYCTNQNSTAKQAKNRPVLKVLKYLSGFVGACVLTGYGAYLYKRMKYRRKGIEPVKNRHYGWRHMVYRYHGYILPSFAVDVIDDIQSFHVREDDIWLVGFPKSGTTWLAEIMYLVNTGADFEGAKTKIDDRFPYFEYFYPGIKVIDDTPSTRYIKTHLPFSLLPEDYHKTKPKTIYIARNPKDTLVSFYFFLQEFFVKSRQFFCPSFAEYCNLFVDDQVYYGPWWKHVIEGWDRRHDDHILYITYEDMKMDLPGSIKKIAKHLEKNLSDQDVQAIASHCSFGAMKNNKSVNYSWYKDYGFARKDGQFIRKGKIGDWKNHLSKEIETKMDDMVKTRLEPLGITFEDSNKTVYIARNPKDTVVSFHCFMQEFFVKTLFNFHPSFDEFCHMFVDDQVYYGPWWKHVIEGWDRRHDDYILFITYEEMKLDLPGSIKKIAKHLGKNLSDQDVEAIASHCSFGAMKNNKSVNYSWFKDMGIANQDGHFIRKGKIGDWKNYLSKEIETKMDDMVKTRLEPLGITFEDSTKVDGK